jgi:hypothetical protein
MNKLFRFIRNYWQILAIIILGMAVSAANFTPGTWLTGWDNLHPEFDFAINFKRSLFASWQEYQGPGLLGGMAHAASLPREIILWILSIAVPAHLLRYLWTFACLVAGPVGAYFLIKSIVKKADTSEFTAGLAALAGAVVYLLNLGTVQTFFGPFEAFISHYAILPWLLYSSIIYFNYPSKKRALFFAILNVVGMTQAYIPTLFLVYLISLALICISRLFTEKILTALKKIFVIGAISFAVNAFWLLPFAYFTFTSSKTTVDAKINQMATGDIFLRNKKFGTLADTLVLRNFWFDNVEYNPSTSRIEPMMYGWLAWDKQTAAQVCRGLLIIIMLTGAVYALMKKGYRIWFLFTLTAFGMIAIDTTPFDGMIGWLRSTVPLLSQFFRFPFTKWVSTLSLGYAVMTGLAVVGIGNIRIQRKFIPVIISVIIVISSVVSVFPVFRGQLISDRMRKSIPEEYFKLFAYLKTRPLGRIANFPQNYFWDWKYYRSGQVGSGFIWYGLKQPVMDRAFDMWSRENENYYWEISRALYAKDPAGFERVLSKYEISYILIDGNITTSGHPLALYNQELRDMLGQIPSYKLTTWFGNIQIYESVNNRGNNFTTLTGNLPETEVSAWMDNDIFYGQNGNYISADKLNPDKSQFSIGPENVNPGFYFPFRTLFTKRNTRERDFKLTENADRLSLETVNDLPVKLSPAVFMATNSGTIDTDGTKVTATITKNNNLVFDSQDAPAFKSSEARECALLKNGEIKSSEIGHFGSESIVLTSTNQRACFSLWAGFVSQSDGYLVIVDHKHITGRPLVFAITNETAKHTELETYLSDAKNQSLTEYFILPPLASDGVGYTAYFGNDSIGRQETVNEIDRVRFYKIPYQEMVNLKIPVNGMEPSAFSNQPVTSVFHPNPSYYKITLQTSNFELPTSTIVLSQSYHPGWKAYQIPKGSAVAQLFPFWFGTEIKNHVMVNNWENGWIINQKLDAGSSKFENTNTNGINLTSIFEPQTSTIVLYFLPQLLEWLGFIILPLPFFAILLTRTHKISKSGMHVQIG